ncbi:MAG: hypothetical protein KKB81_06430 [Candidatus Margulisbacteria bacterium]|nr:hypothetical protein [Candidatus Margulisiibacteriota bacterium]MBU1022433.1 hypothetical protein [Candidatus Margulisiibacteriota bacterium]MBU1728417.1 hypothetical protein [Candidatus Margulisiibacteriota bacterium]MBU1767999.1 hypothetical protein [Candidatus Omnitrophota bacterium]MBU1954564.1 hypothetical protein [Candidatus Margulisiibacteriota bacterium]
MAALYAAYEPRTVTRKAINLANLNGSHITISGDQARMFGLVPEYRNLRKGVIYQSLAFFDRDTLLSLQTRLGLSFEPESDSNSSTVLARPKNDAGLKLRWDTRIPPEERMLPKEALVASLDLLAGAEITLTIFQEDLWDQNFDLPPWQTKNALRRAFRGREDINSMLFLAMELFGRYQ